MLRTFDNAVDVVTVGVVLLTDDEHQQFGPVALELVAEALGVQLVGKVEEVLLGKRVCDPLPIDHLAFGERNVDRVGDPVLEVVGLVMCGGGHGMRYGC